VGIGASAGGQEALEQLFTVMPHDCGISFVVIMHLPSKGPSLLADHLSRYTPMAVVTAEEGMPLHPDRVHVIPAGRDLSISGNLIRLDEPDGTHHPIDRLFQSLAAEAKEHAVAVVLSGFGTDGAEGVKMVRDAGGIVMVQEPATAIEPTMPRSAIATGVADFILPTEQMPGKITEIVRGTCILPPRVCLAATIDEELSAIFSTVKARTGHDFSSYKRNTVIRRIERRMAVNEVGGLKKYIALLEQNPQEAHALCQDILIGVTSFFRDPEAFETIRTEVIPRLFAGRDPDDPVRIWHACCATGEEVYSMAILVREYLDKQGLNFKVQFFASDIDEAAVAQARAGLYSDDIGEDVGQERLEAFFTRFGARWQVKKSLREMVVFAHHSLIKDPPFSRLDLLVCRNFLIYLNPDMQKRLVALFHQVLKPGGFLFLGSSETVGRQSDLFTTLDKKYKIFTRRESERKIETIFPFSTSVRMPVLHRPIRPPVPEEPGPGAIVEKLLLERHSPPCVVVNEYYDVVYVSRRLNWLLEVPVGEPTRDILKMAREELRPSLRAAIYKSFAEQKPVEFRGVKVAVEGVETAVNVQVEPLNAPQADRLAMVVFESLPSAATIAVTDGAKEGAHREETSNEMLIRQMEEQLRITHEQLQVTSEQLETSNEGFMSINEELMSINEEFQSTNEELQSTNEELETSKEELQALNEELITVNTELQGKVEELNQANSDMENLLTSSEIATIFLDRKLAIKRFSPAMSLLFNLIPADNGRPFRHFAGKIDWSTFTHDAGTVLAGQPFAEQEVTTLSGERCYLKRLLPYRNPEGGIDGIVVTFIDITERKRAEEALQESEEQLRTLADSIPNLTWWANGDGYITWYNRRWYEYTGTTPEQMEGWGWQSVHDPQVLPKVLEQWKASIATGQPFDMEFPLRGADGVFRSFLTRVLPLKDSAGLVLRWFGTNTDISAMKQAQEALRESKEQLQLFIEHAPAALAMFDTDMRYLSVSRRWRHDYGLGDRNLIGESQYDIFPEITPEWREAHRRGLAGEVLREEGDRFVRADGSVQWVRWEIRPWHDTAGSIGGIVIFSEDITDIKQAEESLRESQQQNQFLANILEVASQPFSVGYPDGRLGLHNDAFEQLTGYTGDELRSIDWNQSLTPSKWREIEREKLEELLRTGRPVRYEKEYLRKDGSRVPIELLVHLAVDPDGKPLYYYAFVTDITERKRAEEALRESEIRYRELVQNANSVIIRWKRDGTLTFFNEYAQEFFGYGEEEIIGRNVSILLPEGESSGGGLTGLLQNIVDHPERYVNNVNENILRDGSQVWMAWTNRPILDKQGQVAEILAIASDITGRKRAEDELRVSEERLSAVFRTSPSGLFVSRISDGLFLEANEAFMQIIGYPTEEVVGQTSLGLDLWVNPEQRDRIVSLMAEQGLVEGFEYQLRRKSGEIIHALSSVRPIVWKGETCILGAIVDITERKLTEELIQRQVEELQASNDDLERFNNASVGRELRMIELKKEVNEMCVQAGLPPRYAPDSEEGQP
jgi:two-component system CheB/CheR fusion protein